MNRSIFVNISTKLAPARIRLVKKLKLNLQMKFIFPIFVSEKKRKNMERIAIIDHDDHRLFIEDIDEGILKRDYNGEEEAYIRDNYSLGENWSWDYITRAEYYPNDFDDPIEVNFKDLI